MLEEQKMEKKQNRSLPGSKSSGTELRKVQDASNVKLPPKNGRRREPNGGSLSISSGKNDKKHQQQQSYGTRQLKLYDKKARAREASCFPPRDLGRTAQPGIDDDNYAELGSVFVQGSKKQNLNHLLNFQMSSRHTHHGNNYSTRGGTGYRMLTTLKHKYNKEQFMLANCQFVVNDRGNYALYMNNPDVLVDWNLIEQIIIQSNDYPSCPICLYPPIAAKITRCGHVYCWSCVLHYLALSDKTWRKCPICYEAVHKTDLKSVMALPRSEFNVGEEITFRLMKRARGTMTPIPLEQLDLRAESMILNMSEAKADIIYSKLLLANTEEILSIISREKQELQLQLHEDGACPEKCFIEQALEMLGEREKAVLDKIQVGSLKQNEEPIMATNVISDFSKENNFKISENPVDDSESFVKFEDLDISSAQPSNAQAPSKYFYFYQVSDGQNIYMHGLNIRMLEHTYGSLDKCPNIVTGVILEKESGSMTEDLRNRLRCFQHLPLTCPFEVVEIELKPPIVKEETLAHFKDQIDMRKRRRNRKQKEEKKRERRIMEEENRLMGKYPVADINLESHQQFPDFSAADMPPLPHSFEDSPSERSESPVSLSTPVGSLTNAAQYSGPSFAKMLTAKPTRTSQWPELLGAERARSPPRLISVTGSSKPSSALLRPQARHASDSDPEDYVPAPKYAVSFSDAIAVALEKASLSQDKNKNKKKKGKQVLFSTSMAYPGK